MVILVRLLKKQNASSLITVTEGGMVMLAKLSQSIKAAVPIEVTGKL